MAKRRIENPALFVCDLQERFREAIWEFPKIVSTSQKMIKAAQILKIPIVATTQNARALGPLVSELGLDSLSDASLLKVNADKTLFSMCTPEVLAMLPQPRAPSTHVAPGAPATTRASAVLLVGIESHICVTQTALDLLARGHAVYVLADAVSSCNRDEVPIALRRLAAAGATVTSSESVLYEVMGDAKIPEFKEIAKLVKESKDSTRDNLAALCRM